MCSQKIIAEDCKIFLTPAVVLPYTKQLALETLIERSRDKILPMMKARRDHSMKWQPSVAVSGLGLQVSITGIFDGELDRTTGVGASRYSRH